MTNDMKPFLKWAGGKRWLTAKYPQLFSIPFRRYVEPFVGSGAVLFHLEPKRSLISDKNAALMNLYSCLKEDSERVEDLLAQHAEFHSDKYYYEARAKRYRGQFERAAQFLYLNRTCWNGLYRENLRGEFNVPRGTKDTVIFDEDDFGAVARVLEGAEICAADFAEVIAKTGEGDFVFVDPPYTVKHNKNNFIKYNEHIFSWSDQIRLAESLRVKASSGASFLVTNAAHKSVINLYKDFAKTVTVSRASVLSGKSEARGKTDEVLSLVGPAWEETVNGHSLSSGQRELFASISL
jgi:DNA adenine methylase